MEHDSSRPMKLCKWAKPALSWQSMSWKPAEEGKIQNNQTPAIAHRRRKPFDLEFIRRHQPGAQFKKI